MYNNSERFISLWSWYKPVNKTKYILVRITIGISEMKNRKYEIKCCSRRKSYNVWYDLLGVHLSANDHFEWLPVTSCLNQQCSSNHYLSVTLVMHCTTCAVCEHWPVKDTTERTGEMIAVLETKKIQKEIRNI